MHRRLLITALIAIVLVSLSWSAEAPAGPSQNQDTPVPGLDGRADAQFISAQKQELSPSVEAALLQTFQYRADFRRHADRLPADLLSAVPGSHIRPLRI